MPLLTTLLVLIVCARLLGQVFSRFNQPAIIGEMLAGVILGPSIFNLITPTPALAGISEFAVFLIVLSAGLEMNFKEVIDSMRGKGAVIALLGFILPLTGGSWSAWHSDWMSAAPFSWACACQLPPCR